MYQVSIAKSYVEQANKKLNPSLLAAIFRNKTDDMMDAADLLKNAASLFVASKEYQQAVEAYERRLLVLQKLKEDGEIPACLMDLAKAQEKVGDTDTALDNVAKAGELFMATARLSQAGRAFADVANGYKKQLELEQACMFYEKAADCYTGCQSDSNMYTCTVEAAHLYAQRGLFEEAAQKYKSVLDCILSKDTLKFNAPAIFLNIFLCKAAEGHDSVSLDVELEKMVDMFPPFDNSRQHKLCVAIQSFVQSRDEEAFAHTISDYDSISNFASTQISMLLHIKNTVLSENAIDLS